jgi:hypothetical protein
VSALDEGRRLLAEATEAGRVVNALPSGTPLAEVEAAAQTWSDAEHARGRWFRENGAALIAVAEAAQRVARYYDGTPGQGAQMPRLRDALAGVSVAAGSSLSGEGDEPQ